MGDRISEITDHMTAITLMELASLLADIAIDKDIDTVSNSELLRRIIVGIQEIYNEI